MHRESLGWVISFFSLSFLFHMGELDGIVSCGDYIAVRTYAYRMK